METITLDPEAFDEITKVLDNPPPPTPAFIALAAKYRDDRDRRQPCAEPIDTAQGNYD